MVGILPVIGLSAVAFAAALAYMLIRQVRFSRQRAGEGFAIFSASLTEAVVPADIQEAVYATLQGGLMVKFAIHADDSLAKVYGITDEDVDDTVRDIAIRCNRVVPEGPARIETVRDLLVLLANSPKVT